MNMEHMQSMLENTQLLDSLESSARLERLEMALPLIDALRAAYAIQEKSHHAPVGVLTVTSWLKLLNQWQETLDLMPKRRVLFLREFFQEAMTNHHLEHTATGPVLQELLVLMEDVLMQDTAQAA